jgi:type IX secretion system PorP/SprF family membrane protein
MIMKRIGLILTALLFASLFAPAQDLHWSQPSSSLLYQNPAFCGITGKYSLAAGYHDQWNAVNASFKSYMVSGDYRFGNGGNQNGASMGLGGMVFSDVAGSGQYRVTAGGVLLSGIVKSSKKVSLAAGIGCNFAQNRIQKDGFTWGAQFNGQNFDPSLSSGENQPGRSGMFADLAAGLALAYDKSEGSAASKYVTKWLFGYSLGHLNRPDVAINGGKDKLHMRHTIFANGIAAMDDNISLKPVLMMYLQGALLEVTGGSLVRFTVGQRSLITGYRKSSAIAVGFLYRVKDAVIPTAEFEKGNMLFGISYDVNVSTLSSYSRLRGGFEVTFRMTEIGNYLYKDKKDEKPSL